MFGVLGGHQIPKDAEIANAYLVRKPSGICLHVVCYVAKDKYKFIWEHPVTKHGEVKKRQWQTFDKPMGIDFKSNGIV
ncbi:MAG: transposase, partial [Thermotogae bacterium]|nr:transposase [Thermotogota bacterium]